MHSAITLALLALLAAPPHAKNTTSSHWTHVRGLSPAARSLITAAANESATVRQLMDALETTDVVAYIEVPAEVPADTWASVPLSSLTLVGASASQRFVLIRVDRRAAATHERAPKVAHELEHALEVARDPTVRDARTLRRLYARIGWEWGNGQFETTAARDAEQRARRERSAAGPIAGSR